MWEPVERALVVKAASPAAEMVVVRRVVAPSSRRTVPVGEPLVVLATWMVRVSGEPGEIVVDEAASVVSVGAGAMISVGVFGRV